MEKNTGNKLKELREEHGLSQEKFANEIGVSRQIVSRWEKGKVIPNISSIKKICDYYVISTNLLLNTNIPIGEEESQPVAKNNKKKLIKGIAIFLLSLLILYLIYTTYKYFLIKDLEERFKKYDNLSNYYAEIRTFKEDLYIGKTEIWYKENEYKIITENNLDDGRKIKKAKWINNKTKEVYNLNANNSNIEKKELIEDEIYYKGNYIKTFFYWLDRTTNESKNIYIFGLNNFYCKENEETKEIVFDKDILKLKDDGYTPILFIQNSNNKLLLNYYKIEYNCINDEDLEIKKDL